ncbi:response regulator [Candidatus Riflebacteria bacterium]
MDHRILIVDDDESITEFLETFLGQYYNVECCLDGNEALEKIKGGKFTIILSDIAMPEMNGIELLRTVKAYNPFIQIIIMTAFSTIENTILSLEQGACDFVLKPFEDIEVVKTVIDATAERLNRWNKVTQAIHQTKS